MRLKELQIKEAATSGATSSANISAANAVLGNPSRQKPNVAYTGKPGGPSGTGPVKQVKGGTYNTGKNALDGDKFITSSKQPTPFMIRRQIQEGVLYEEQLNEIIKELIVGGIVISGVLWLKDKFGNWFKSEKGKTQAAHDKRMNDAGLATPTPVGEGLRIEPRGEAGQANAFKQAMANVSKNKETRAINTEKSKRQTAQAAGYRAIVGGKDVSQIAKG